MFDPLTSKYAFKPPSAWTNGVARQRWIAFQISESKCKFLGSKFSRIVPENRKLSCGTKEIRDRRIFNGNVDMSHESIVIFPEWSGAIRNNADIIELFPAPVLPTIPIRSHEDAWNVIFFNDDCKYDLENTFIHKINISEYYERNKINESDTHRYFNETFSYLTTPWHGHPNDIALSLPSAFTSVFNLLYA